MPIIIFLLIITANFPVDIHVPAMPVMARDLGMSVSMTQWTISLFLLGYGVFPIVFGSLSDALGRKRVVLVALVILTLAGLITVFTDTPWVVLASRLLQGAAASACIAIPRAIMRDCYKGAAMAKIASLIGVGVELSLAMSPVIGGFLVAHFGWHSNFLFISVLSLLVFFVVLLFFQETNQHRHPELLRLSRVIENARSVFSHGTFLRYVACSAAAFSSAMAFFAISPFIVQNKLGYTPEVYGLTVFIATGSLVCGSVCNAIFVHRAGVNRMVPLGLSLLLFAGVVLLLVKFTLKFSLLVFMGPVVIAFFGLAFLFGNCMSGALYPFPKLAGVAGSIYSTIQVSASFAVSVIISALDHDNAVTIAVVFIVMSSLALLNFVRNKHHAAPM